MLIGIAAIQAELEPEHYLTPQAFGQRVIELTGAAAEALPGVPRVVAFPELFALPLLFWLEASATVLESHSFTRAALKILGLNPRHLSPRGFYHLRTPLIYPLYEAAFRQAAIATQSYIFGGTFFGPALDWEPVQKLHPLGAKAYNWGLFFSPQGAILARPAKARLTATERHSFLSGGEPGYINTKLGTIATLICLDAFHEALAERADAYGAWLLIQPSANSRKWSGPWSGDPAQLEGEVWLREGLAKKLVGRENLRYGINPMLNGKFYELEFEGRSSLAQTGGFLALAEKPVGDEILAATIELPGHPPPLAKS